MSSTQMFTVFDIVLAVFRSPIKFLFWFLIFFSLVVLTYLVLPRQYGSDGKLFVQVGRSSVGAAPTTSAGKVSLQDSRETEVKSVVGLIESRELAERVIDVVGVDKILEPHSRIGRWLKENSPQLSFDETPSSDESELSDEEIEAINERNEAVEELMDSLQVGHQKNTTVVSIGIKAGTPFLAQKITQAYLDEYQKKHVEVNTPQSGGFFSQQLKLRQTELAQCEKRLANFRSELDVLDIAGARSLLQREIDQLKLDLLGTEVSFSQAKEKYANIKRDYARVPEFIVGADKKTSSLARDKAREALYNLELEESALSAKYRSSNPQLIEIREAISKAKRQLSRIPTSFKEAQRNINPAHKEILVMLTRASAEASGFQKRLQATKQLVREKLSEIENLNTLALQESQLTQGVDICRKTMLGMADKTAESVTLDALDSERISNVTVAQAASLVPKKVFPSGLSFASIGGLLSLLLATIMTFLKEFRLGYQLDQRQRQIAMTQHAQQGQTREVPRQRVAREQALAAASIAGAGDQGYTGIARDQGYQSPDQETYRDERFPEKDSFSSDRDWDNGRSEEESRRDLTEAELASRKRIETRKRRSENQISVWMLLAGFTVVVLGCFLLAALR